MMHTHTFVSPGDVKTARRVLAWARSHLTREHECVNRPYPPKTVCPFVEASIKMDYFYMVLHNEVNGRDLAAIADLILGYINPFKEANPLTHSEQMLKALLIVFPNIEERFLTVLDECHQMIRPKITSLGLMIGQFHRKCRERAIHNPQWNAISRSSVPLMAMRHMVIHDIMFLQDDKEAFRVYDSKFGFRFAKRATSLPPYQKHLIAYYERAKSNYSDTESGYRQG